MLCKHSELPEDGNCKEFQLGDEYFFAIRQRDKLFIYKNSCPHVGTPLNWQKDTFFNAEKCFIQCFSHGALFEIDTGLCIAGPCHGQSLTAVKHQLKAEGIFI
ncbi:MAG: Rieske (2Fe-2S) protein [Pseudomonadales bacterium]|nr:Rieske (2Fe-2S) protein [Pseudomonadales bacterium]